MKARVGIALSGVLLSMGLVVAACGGSSIGTTNDNDGGTAGPDGQAQRDGALPPDGGRDGGVITPECEPAAVADDTCINCLVPVFQGAFWDGMACFELIGCGCAGEGCSRGYSSLADCENAHQYCDSTTCLGTGGEWFPADFCGPCGHYQCGLPSPLACCDAGCNCGPGQLFWSGSGCLPDPSCSAESACMATGGQWHPQSECYCGFTCGQPGDCQACLDSCDCGAFRNFDPVQGCRWDVATCGDPNEQARCEDTLGTWHQGDGCGHFTCGRPNLLDPCVMPGCDCGPNRNFDSQLGCVYDDACVLADLGEDCRGSGDDSTCRAGLVCCEGCGMAPGCQICATPCCADDGSCQSDGCYPPPP